jgi:imidazolonepropionase-like amidohydrolase
MRLDFVLDSVYLLGSLWGVSTGPQICTSNPPAVPRPMHEAVWVPGPSAAAVTAFVDVNVVPMDTERVLAHQTVLVAGGHITALGPASQVKVPAGAVRVDGRGKYLMPGLTDMHLHSFHRYLGRHDPPGVNPLSSLTGVYKPAGNLQGLRDSIFRALASGVTSARLLDGRVNSTPPRSQVLRDLPAGTRPRLYFAPPDPTLVPLDSIGAHVAAAKAAGYDFVMMEESTWEELSPDSILRGLPSPRNRAVFDSLLAAVRRVGIPVATHIHSPLPFEAMLAVGAAGGGNGSDEHLYSFADSLGYLEPWKFFLLRKEGKAPAEADMPPVSDAQLRRLAAAAQRAGVWITPTLNCTSRNGMASATHLAVMRRLVKALHDAGVGLLLAGDDGNSVHEELAALVGAGLSPYQALVTGTRNPAEWFGRLDSAGTVAAGKRTDLVLLHGNPLQDLRHTREPAGVMVEGRWLDRAALDQGLLTSKSWLRAMVWGDIVRPYRRYPQVLNGSSQKVVVPPVTEALVKALGEHVGHFERLTDSLAASPAKSAEYERLLRSQAAALGAMRASLTPEQHIMFDRIARVWLREQARQGHAVTVPGVITVP